MADGHDRRCVKRVEFVDDRHDLVRRHEPEFQAGGARVDHEDVGHALSTARSSPGSPDRRPRMRGCTRAPRYVVDHLLPQMSRTGRQAGHAVDYVHDEVEPVQVVEHHHVERRCGGALLLVATHVQVRVTGTSVGQAVDEPGVAVIREHHGPVRREEGVELGVRKPVWMFRLGLQAHEVDDVHDPHLQLRQSLAQDRRGRDESRASGCRRSMRAPRRARPRRRSRPTPKCRGRACSGRPRPRSRGSRAQAAYPRRSR